VIRHLEHVSICLQSGQGVILSKVLINGFGSNACWAGPDRRLMGIALSARSSIKSLTMKSLFEKFSKVKLGPFGKIDLPLPVPLVKDAIEYVEESPKALSYIEAFKIQSFISFVNT
jgi:hypothetical protein